MSIHLKLLLATLFWGATPTIGRMLASYQAPFAVVGLRFAVAAAILCWFMRRAGLPLAIPRRWWARCLVLGVTGTVLHNGLMYKGLEYISATTTSLILALIAAQIVLLDWLCCGRRPKSTALAGVALAFAGTAWVVADGDLSALSALAFGPGECLAFLSALSWAVYSLVGRAVLEREPPLAVTTWATVVGSVLLLPALFAEPDMTRALVSDPRALALIGFLALFGSALAFLWYYQGVLHLGTVGTAVYLNLTPVFGILCAHLAIGEPLAPSLVFGAALVVAGLALVNRAPARAARTVPAVVAAD